MSFYAAAKRIRGNSHRKSHHPCQDAVKIGRGIAAANSGEALETSFFIVGALADGGGSRSLSHVGARLSVSVATSSMRAAWTDASLNDATATDLNDYWHLLFRDCRRALEFEVEARAIPKLAAWEDTNPLACTLIAFMATRNRVAVAQVGDGFLVVGSAKTSGEPVEFSIAFQNRQYGEAGQVVWLTAPYWDRDLRTSVLDGGIDFILASSDGMEKAVLDYNAGSSYPRAQYFQQFRDGCHETVAEARAANISAQSALDDYLHATMSLPRLDIYTDDDKSMALAFWRD